MRGRARGDRGDFVTKNAVRKSQRIFKNHGFSKSGLIEQLEFEGFSNEDATYAANELNVDWKEQAVKKPKNI